MPVAIAYGTNSHKIPLIRKKKNPAHPNRCSHGIFCEGFKLFYFKARRDF